MQGRKYLISVYALPAFMGLIFCGAVFFLSLQFKLVQSDKILGYIIGVFVAFVIYVINKTKWLPLPDGSYIHRKSLNSETDKIAKEVFSKSEPVFYTSEFSTSLTSKLIYLIGGAFLIYAGLVSFSDTNLVFPALIAASGIFLLYLGIKEFANPLPKLKVAKEGLWTRQLGFRSWHEIKKTEIKEEKGHRSTQIYLEIYLKSSSSDYPTQRLLINELNNRNKIKATIEELTKGL
jgi:hypothetical protein